MQEATKLMHDCVLHELGVFIKVKILNPSTHTFKQEGYSWRQLRGVLPQHKQILVTYAYLMVQK